MSHNILDAREERVFLQQELQKVYTKPLLVLRVNIPGKEKNTPVSHGIFGMLENELKIKLAKNVVVEKMLNSAEGPVMIRVVDMAPEVLKSLAMEIEDNHPLGRFVDLDVYDLSGISLSRSGFGHGPRSCYICNEPAHECARARRHPLNELLAVMETVYLDSLD